MDKDMDMDMEGESSIAPPDGVAAPASPRGASARLCGASAPPREKALSGDEKMNIKRRDAETFRGSLRAEAEGEPGFAGIEAAFCDYRPEADPRGRFRFAPEKTRSTAGRLRSWLRREEERRPPTFSPNICPSSNRTTHARKESSPMNEQPTHRCRARLEPRFSVPIRTYPYPSVPPVRASVGGPRSASVPLTLSCGGIGGHPPIGRK